MARLRRKLSRELPLLHRGEADALAAKVETLTDSVDEYGRNLRKVESSLEAGAQPAQLLVDQFQTLAYVSDALPLELYSHSRVGRVLGYRDQHREIPEGEAYTFFSDVFRGDAERVRELQRCYIPLLDRHEPVLDVGCGRGEMLDLLREAGLDYAGVDNDPAMVERCVSAGHAQVALADGTEHLEGLRDDSIGAIVTLQVVEHLPPRRLRHFLALARRKLREDGVLIVETVNPYAVPSFRAFWVDPTHEWLLFPETLLALCRIAGFPAAFVFHPERCEDVEDDRFVCGSYAVVASAA